MGGSQEGATTSKGRREEADMVAHRGGRLGSGVMMVQRRSSGWGGVLEVC
jgi:hypothetical protein